MELGIDLIDLSHFWFYISGDQFVIFNFLCDTFVTIVFLPGFSPCYDIRGWLDVKKQSPVYLFSTFQNHTSGHPLNVGTGPIVHCTLSAWYTRFDMSALSGWLVSSSTSLLEK